jgi:predicted ABC-class ATPase
VSLTCIAWLRASPFFHSTSTPHANTSFPPARSRGRGGRGAFYKAKYGGGRGRSDNASEDAGAPPRNTGPRDWDQLQRDLKSIDGQQYGKHQIPSTRKTVYHYRQHRSFNRDDVRNVGPRAGEDSRRPRADLTFPPGAYKRLLGRYEHSAPSFSLSVDHVQGDAYAAPSRVRAVMPLSQTGFPTKYLQSEVGRVALCDFLTRTTASIIRDKHLDKNVGGSNGGWSSPKGGAFNINAPGQEVLPRTSAIVNGDETIELRFTVALPAAGRTVLGQQANQILALNLVELVKNTLLHKSLNEKKLARHVSCVENQHHLRHQLSENNLIAFVANGSILPRASGASATPMVNSSVVPFQSPPELSVTLTQLDGIAVTGMGIKKGITLLTGGGFHGKSTLLEALELGVYDHVPNDGREQIVTDPSAVKIRAEDGRPVSGTDISPFISSLPGGRDPKSFSTDDASGSTSMAANIQEALEVGSECLLIDEDSSATNLLVRDARMQALIRNEPITPLVSKVRALYNQHGVSTVMVVGGLGDWLSVADSVIAMDYYVPRLITSKVEAVLKRFPSEVAQDAQYGSFPQREVQVRVDGEISPYTASRSHINIKPAVKNPVNDPSQAPQGINLQFIDQLVEVGQARMIAATVQRFVKATAGSP